MNKYIGVDLGTSGLKLLLVAADGSILDQTALTYPVSYPRDGWSEQNPEDWFAALMRGFEQLGARDVAGISFGGQMHGLVALDAAGEVVRPCILWNDGRTERETEYLNTLPVAEYTGNMAFAGFTAPKLLWLSKNEEQNFARTAKIMLPKDYLAYKLTGRFATDYSDASGTLLLDVKNRRWSSEMCDICGISAGQLPQLFESYQPVGFVKREICERFGWGKVVVAAGAGDNAAAAVGTGCVNAGDCNVSLGTSGTVFIASDKFVQPSNNALHSFAHANGRYHLMGCILSAASANKWWIEDILGAGYDLPGAEALLGSNPVMFAPYLTGERCPHNDVGVRGAFVGLSPQTTRLHMSLAVLEGVAFALRDCLELARSCGIAVRASSVCGGGARSALWQKIIANVLNVELSTLKTEQGPAYGAAMLAMVACGEYADVASAAAAIVSKRPSVAPEKGLAAAYDERYKKFRALYPALKKWQGQ